MLPCRMVRAADAGAARVSAGPLARGPALRRRLRLLSRAHSVRSSARRSGAEQPPEQTWGRLDE